LLSFKLFDIQKQKFISNEYLELENAVFCKDIVFKTITKTYIVVTKK